MPSKPAPRHPHGDGWFWNGIAPMDPTMAVWVHVSGVGVLSSTDWVDYEKSDGVAGMRWEHHISVAFHRRADAKRAHQDEVNIALKAFGFPAESEDNHLPGVARHFWRPIDNPMDVVCPCIEREQEIDEGDGFKWRPLPQKNKPDE